MCVGKDFTDFEQEACVQYAIQCFLLENEDQMYSEGSTKLEEKCYLQSYEEK
jgi:hypothetical protein